MPLSVALERVIMLVVLFLIAGYSLAPFEASEYLSTGNKIYIDLLDPVTMNDVAGTAIHLFAFYLLGALLADLHGATASSKRLWVLLCVTLVLGCGMELGKVFVDGRHASAANLLANAVGGVVGVVFGFRQLGGHPVLVAAKKVFQRITARAPYALLLCGLMIWINVGYHTVASLTDMGWQNEYPLAIVNETDGSRPWLGELRFIGIYRGALTPDEIRFAHMTIDSSARSNRGGHLDMLAGYDFERGERGPIASTGSVKSADLAVRVTETVEGRGLRVTEGTIIESRGSAALLTRALSTAGAFSVEAWIRPLHDSQYGPARVVGISAGTSQRNFMLGQEGDKAVFRVRNGISGDNGARYQLEVEDAMGSALQHFVATYDHGLSRLYRDGRALWPSVDLREPNASLGLGTNSVARLAGCIWAIITIGLPAHLALAFVRRTMMRHLLALAATFGVASLSYLVPCTILGAPFTLGFMASLGMATAVAYPLLVAYVLAPLAEGG